MDNNQNTIGNDIGMRIDSESFKNWMKSWILSIPDPPPRPPLTEYERKLVRQFLNSILGVNNETL